MNAHSSGIPDGGWAADPRFVPLPFRIVEA